MSEIARPYFMTNEEWYTYNVEKGELELTDKAPPKAIKSYKEYYELVEKLEEPDWFEEL